MVQVTHVIVTALEQVLWTYGVLVVISLVAWYAVADFRELLTDLYQTLRDEVRGTTDQPDPAPTLVDWQERGWCD